MASIRSWLKRMRSARDPGPATRVTLRPAKAKSKVVDLSDHVGAVARDVEKLWCRETKRQARRGQHLRRSQVIGNSELTAHTSLSTGLVT